MEMEIVVSLVIFLVGVAVLAMIHLCVVARVFRTGFENSEDKIPRRISKEDLNNLPCFDYIAPQGEDSISGDCVVCLEMFNEGDKCRLLPNCNHSFHVQCIDLWLLKTSLCPICRSRVSQTLSQQTSISVSVAVELT